MARGLFALFAAIVICSAVQAAQQRLTLKDGRVVSGNVTKTEGGYRVETAMGAVEYSDSQVVAVEDIVSPETLYQQRLAEIDPNSPEDHFHLGEFALKQRLLDQAAEQFREALNLRPQFEQASLMLERVEYLRARAAAASQPATAATEPVYPGGYTPQEIRDEWLLTDEDINWIRLAELRPTDRVRIDVDNDTVDRFIAMKRGTGDFRDVYAEQRFRGLPPMQKALYILSRTTEQDTGIRAGIKVLGNPQFMIDYRRYVWPIVGRTCGAPECHGGDRAPGRLKLFRSYGTDDRIDYTNFVILDGYVSSSGRARMIDRANPTRSLLLQYGLIEQEAEFTHPQTGGRSRVIFPSVRSPAYTSVLNWVMSLHRPVHPDYHLTYSPPFGMKLDFATSPSALSGAASAPSPSVPQAPAVPPSQRPGP